eukprot:NODE_485_length_1697_cov_106.109830_g403_i0.p1 GENE.NODE_485_length_1697_cov_106.109830_g403_i0~~NODE_485_length_1697_cov_106.109830_g403_i0.p1  ORF type:complete len:146 (+),score=44.46 NODE_485_length_1697_cov_106.109830_g403_i0:1107-1544(+)
MVGSVVQAFRGEMDEDFHLNTMKENRMDIALAPGDGLMLEKVCYDSFNRSNKCKEGIELKLVEQKEELEAFRITIVQHMIKQEVSERKFSKWLSDFDTKADGYYINLERLFKRGAHAESKEQRAKQLWEYLLGAEKETVSRVQAA